MGIYPNQDWEEHRELRAAPQSEEGPPGTTATFTYSIPGWEVVKVYELVAIFENRTDCYCCSCSDWSSDPYCRNHGFAAARPCEVHGTAGEPNEEGEMPDSVQAIWRWREAKDKKED